MRHVLVLLAVAVVVGVVVFVVGCYNSTNNVVTVSNTNNVVSVTQQCCYC